MFYPCIKRREITFGDCYPLFHQNRQNSEQIGLPFDEAIGWTLTKLVTWWWSQKLLFRAGMFQRAARRQQCLPTENNPWGSRRPLLRRFKRKVNIWRKNEYKNQNVYLNKLSRWFLSRLAFNTPYSRQEHNFQLHPVS